MTADVCYVLEGTYPYVPGGVSSWVHTLIQSMPELTFHVLHLSPQPNFYPLGLRYELPENVVGVDEVYLQVGASELQTRCSQKDVDTETMDVFSAFVEGLKGNASDPFSALFRVANNTEQAAALRSMLLQSPDAWKVMLDAYKDEAELESFVHFVWTWRFALMPFLNGLAAEIPPARVYHTPCTGYAGVIAAGAKARTGRPMLLTEHGIYTKERRIDIQSATWIPDLPPPGSLVPNQAPYFRRFWMRQFDAMSRICYEASDEILTLYEGNRRLQVDGGAPSERLRIIPNGIHLERFGEVHPDAEEPDPDVFTIGFIGRVCPIKDVRTLLQALRLVVDEMPMVRVRILGPLDEEEYVEDCRRLCRVLRLENNVLMEGMVNIPLVLPTLDVCVLSSISEAQPLALLEVGAMGVPTVATDVGSCSELLAGRTPDDKALGEGGLVVPMASPGALAKAILRVARDDTKRKAMGEAMRQRVRKHYNIKDMVDAYEALYRKYARAA